MKHLFVRLLVTCAAVALFHTAFSAPPSADAALTRAETIAQTDDFRRTTWRFQELMGKRRTPTNYMERRTTDQAFRVWVRNLWLRRAAAVRRQAQDPPHRDEWMCIHRHERHPAQGWRTRTGNGYYGGLQMDLTFQRMYGPELLRRKGTANNWTPAEQMWIAERAYRSGRGFHPWPNTARYCGLI